LALARFLLTPLQEAGRDVAICATGTKRDPPFRNRRARIAYTNGYTYLRAYCNLRDQERTFRLDRIRSWEQNGWEQRGAGDEEKRDS
jgi:predicted secreted protein